jgi:outer membrane protein OmpA-like peptidoglycan-associated protein
MKTALLFFILLGACTAHAQSNSFKLTDSVFTINSIYTSYSENVYNSCSNKFNVAKIDSIKQFLKSNPSINIQIEWHTNQRGGTEYNKLFSERSATHLKQIILTDSTITKNRISVIGYGESKLIYDDEAIARLKTVKEKELAYHKNSRVEIRIIKL